MLLLQFAMNSHHRYEMRQDSWPQEAAFHGASPHHHTPMRMPMFDAVPGGEERTLEEIRRWTPSRVHGVSFEEEVLCRRCCTDVIIHAGVLLNT